MKYLIIVVLVMIISLLGRYIWVTVFPCVSFVSLTKVKSGEYKMRVKCDRTQTYFYVYGNGYKWYDMTTEKECNKYMNKELHKFWRKKILEDKKS